MEIIIPYNGILNPTKANGTLKYKIKLSHPFLLKSKLNSLISGECRIILIEIKADIYSTTRNGRHILKKYFFLRKAKGNTIKKMIPTIVNTRENINNPLLNKLETNSSFCRCKLLT